MANQIEWDKRFLDLCRTVSKWSKDPSTQVGAVIVAPDRRIVSLGYNGFPRKIEDRPERLSDRPVKYKLTVHAEMNALLNAMAPVAGCTLYVSPFISCTNCTIHIIQSGVVRVVAPQPTRSITDRWGADIELARMLYSEAGIEIGEYPDV